MLKTKLSIEERVNWLEEAVYMDDPMAKLAIEHSWNYGKLQEIYNVMNFFSMEEPYSYHFGDIERAFASIGFNYQDLKGLFDAFWRKGEFLPVLTRYLETNAETFKNISGGYDEMYEDLVLREKALIPFSI